MRMTLLELIIKEVALKRIALIAFSLEFVDNAGKSVQRVIIIATVMVLELLAKRKLLSLGWVLLGVEIFQLIKGIVVGVIVGVVDD
jgi:hypothetical protein